MQDVFSKNRNWHFYNFKTTCFHLITFKLWSTNHSPSCSETRRGRWRWRRRRTWSWRGRGRGTSRGTTPAPQVRTIFEESTLFGLSRKTAWSSCRIWRRRRKGAAIRWPEKVRTNFCSKDRFAVRTVCRSFPANRWTRRGVLPGENLILYLRSSELILVVNECKYNVSKYLITFLSIIFS